MFDIGFIELLLISVVALLVLGPERLPGAIRTMGLWIGRLRRSFNNIKRDIEKEIGADEIRRQLRNEAIMEKFDSSKKQFTETIDSVKKQADSVKQDFDLKNQVSGLVGTKSGDKKKSGTESGTELPEEIPTGKTTVTPPVKDSVDDNVASLDTSKSPDSSEKPDTATRNSEQS